MAIHTLTNGERYKIGKVNNTAVILESTDEAGSAYTLRPTQFICETSASVKINLQGSNNSGVPVLWLNNTFNGTNSDCFIRFDSTTGANIWVAGFDSSTESFVIDRSSAVNASAPSFIILGSNENVGLGTNNPSSKLHVVGTGNITGNTTIGGTLGVSGATTLSSTLGVAGNILIGGTSTTSTPSLDKGVYLQSQTNDDVIGYNLYVNETSHNRRACFFLNDDTGLYGFDATASTGVPDFVIQSGTIERFRVTGGGTVKIAGLTSNGTVVTTGGTGTLSVSSDSNLKDADGFVENGLEKVLALKPRYFYWKDKEQFGDNRQLGFFAQEVNEISEETANTPSYGGGWGVYDRGLVALLTAAIQEQNQTIQDLKTRLDAAGL